MERQLGDKADRDADKDVIHVENLILLSSYDEAASVSLGLVSRFPDGTPESDALFQRLLAAALQAHFFSGRQQDIEAVVEKLGISRLTVPTLVDWAILLLENGQAPAARQLVERYMGLMTVTQPGQLPGATSPTSTSPAHPHPHPPLGSAATTLADRAALARLYSQDVLSLGLQLPKEALRWLAGGGSSPQTQDPSPSSLSPQPSGKSGRASDSDSVGAVAAAAPGVVLGARELVGCEETLRQLTQELTQLLAASGMLRRASLDHNSSRSGGGNGNGNGAHGGNGHGNGNGNGGNGAQMGKRASMDAGARGAITGGGLGGPLVGKNNGAKVGGHLAAAAAAAAAAGARRDSPAAPLPPQAGSTQRKGAALSRAGSSSSSSCPGVSTAAAASAGARPAGLAGLYGMLRSWWSAVLALVQRLESSSRAQLSAAQAWLVCKAASTVRSLRAAAPGPTGFLAHLYGALTSSPSASPYGWYGNAAVALAVVTLVLVAATAEAPHLRAALHGMWVWLAGLVREAASMAMSMHTSPVAVAASTAAVATRTRPGR